MKLRGHTELLLITLIECDADGLLSSRTRTPSQTKAIFLTAHPVLQAAVARQTFYLTMAVLFKQVERGYSVWQMCAVCRSEMIGTRGS